jgi:endonuclease/exonuclease/phosphatase family metal-dependent hydrolase
MMRLLSWNVQWCRGLDGNVDPGRIASQVHAMGAHVACLQEIASNFTDLPGSKGEDQPIALWQGLPEHQPIVGWGVDIPARDATRMRFGNMILSRLPVARILRHSLPWPASPDAPSMPRAAVEAALQTPLGPLRVITTHLESSSGSHRAAQVRRLKEILLEGSLPRKAADEPGPFRAPPSPASAILCGDFNLAPDDPLHRELLDCGLVDAWQALNPGQPHPPTFRLHARKEGVAPYCCDFVFVTPNLAPRLRSIRIDADNRASDHQPVMVELR